jgi:Skp family chaperone for outer membrane proteins
MNELINSLFVYLLNELFQGIGKLSLVAASAANVVQASTKDITSKVFRSILFNE